MGAKFLPILLCLLFTFERVQCQIDTVNAEYAPAQYFYKTQSCIDDLVYLKAKLQDAHPCLYCYTDSISVQLKFNELITSLQSINVTGNQEISQEAFTQIVKQYLALFKDGHLDASNTAALFRYIENEGKFFPIQVLFENNKVYIRHDYSGYLDTIALGAELVSINDIPIKDIMPLVYKSTSAGADIHVYKTRQLENLEKFGIAYWMLNGPANTYKVTFAVNDSSLQTTILPGITAKEIILINEKQSTKPILQISDTSSVAYMGINSFEGIYEKQEVVYLWKFLENSFKTINQHKVESLIIDLRDNPGGMIYNAHLLLNYISAENIESAFQIKSSNLLKENKNKHGIKGFFQRNFDRNSYAAKIAHTPVGRFIPFSSKSHFVANEKLKFKGKVYLLVNGNTFSAAGLFTKYFREQQLGVILGEECGSSPTFSFGNTLLLDLPNTDVQVYLPTAIVANDTTHNYQNRGIMPDIPVKRVISEEVNNNDSVLKQVYKLINRDKHQLMSSSND